MRSILLSFVFLMVGSVVFGQTSLDGKVTDTESGEAILFGNVALYKNGNLITGTDTDFDGNYVLSNIDPGTYDLEVSFVGYTPKRVTGVVVYAGKSNKLNVEISSGVTLDIGAEIIEYKVPLIEQDNTSQGGTITAEEIKNLPTRNINSLVSRTAGVASNDEGGALNFRGSRSDGTSFFVDGIRVISNNIPTAEIDQLQTITAGIEAQYGDVTGGVVSITTKGPSRNFSGGIQVETSEFLDAYNHTFINANISGPILKNKEGRSILGYRLSGEYRRQEDDDPIATPHYVANSATRSALSEDPITLINGSFFPSAEFITNDGIDAVDARKFEDFSAVNLNAKLDARLSDAIDITLTGAYVENENMFTPATRGGPWTTFNSFNNPTVNNTRYRGNFRFRHRFGNNASAATDAEGQAAKNALIRNLNYTLQFGFERQKQDRSDPRHGNNYFDYGYIGQYGFTEVPVLGTREDGTFGHVDYRQDFVEGSYAPSTINQGLVNYNKLIDQTDINDFIARNGQISTQYTSAWGLHANINQVYNLVNKNEQDRYTLNASASFDIFPGGSDNGRHNIQFGLLYEQRTSRNWTLNPSSLWEVARQTANNHLTGVDTNIVVDTIVDPISGMSFLQFARLADDNPGGQFWKAVRDRTGQTKEEWVNIDGLTPDQLSLDMFNARELTDLNLLGYNGYDYLGNKVGSEASFDDFWRVVSDPGAPVERNFVVAPWQPNYSAAYIQDKFTFKDIIFRLGLRVDRFDANTKVLKDPFSFYEVMGAGEFHSITPTDKPATIGDDYKVYTQSTTSNSVKAYRSGSQWFFEDGTPANDGSLIFGGEVVHPKLVNPDVRVRDAEFNPNNSFEDYEPQVNWMPRLAFSFPISDVANFFAHYDVLVQRPGNIYVSPMTYFYFTEPGRVGTEGNPVNNANLKPRRTIDYAVGFQQKLSNSSALKINAYYREIRDDIQQTTIPFVPILNTYSTFGNEDFGTVKGFTFQYDLRRTNNVQLRIDYTLQFADGTGSNATSQRGLTSRGNLRTLFPLSYDERHRVNVTLDYRYGSGKKYNGPVLGGVDIFENAGINLLTTGFSGRPYTKTRQPEILGGSGTVGSINGARLPWSIRLDLRADKSFRVGGKESKHPLSVNVYFRVQNLLDARNIIGVYSATGSETDDGYLESSRGESALTEIVNSGRSIDPYVDAYSWRVLNPDRYSRPRAMFLGATVNF